MGRKRDGGAAEDCGEAKAVDSRGGGLEEAEVHWPGKGKSKGKIWKCMLLPEEVE